MSDVRLNILDAKRAISGMVHGSMADAVVAALSADPETIEELEAATVRFSKCSDDCPPFAGFRADFSDEPYDAGIVIIDLAARVVAIESSYSMPGPEGYVEYHNGREKTEVLLPYQLSDDWLFLDCIAEYEGISDQRRAERAAAPPLDTRTVLYGAVTEFVVNQCLAALDSNAENPVPEIHARWLMTPRVDLRGMAPREVMLKDYELVDFDLHSREIQWSFLNEPAPCLKKDSSAFRFGGFGTHEIVIYYDLVRRLIAECWERVSERKMVSLPDEIMRLEQIKAEWLVSPDPESGGESPAYIIDCERKRLPWVMSPEESMIDEDCPCCRAMASGKLGPGFNHLDGCNMDDDFPFSFYRTRKEWDEEKRRQNEFMEEFDRKWERDKSQSPAN